MGQFTLWPVVRHTCCWWWSTRLQDVLYEIGLYSLISSRRAYTTCHAHIPYYSLYHKSHTEIGFGLTLWRWYYSAVSQCSPTRLQRERYTPPPSSLTQSYVLYRASPSSHTIPILYHASTQHLQNVTMVLAMSPLAGHMLQRPRYWLRTFSVLCATIMCEDIPAVILQVGADVHVVASDWLAGWL